MEPFASRQHKFSSPVFSASLYIKAFPNAFRAYSCYIEPHMEVSGLKEKDMLIKQVLQTVCKNLSLFLQNVTATDQTGNFQLYNIFFNCCYERRIYLLWLHNMIDNFHPFTIFALLSKTHIGNKFIFTKNQRGNYSSCISREVKRSPSCL